MHPETPYTLALSLIDGMGSLTQRRLIEACGSAQKLFAEADTLPQLTPKARQLLCREAQSGALLKRAQTILEREANAGNQVISLFDESYPKLLYHAADAPVVLFYRGNAEALAAKHMLAIVGTRNATRYGKAVVPKIIQTLHRLVPDIVIVSGLAFGIDICAGRTALEEGIPTIAVLASGLDYIYPREHLKEARQMTELGGLLSEHPLGTGIERHQFVARNRIIAGLCPATLVIESALHGGALLTASMAIDYDRDVFAVPGRLTDPYSQGCNRLIASEKAATFYSAEDLVDALGWSVQSQKSEQTLFPERTLPDDPIINLLRKADTMHFNEIILALKCSPAELSGRLFDLELDGYIEAIPGGRYAIALK